MLRRLPCFPKKPDSVINVKVEFGEDEGKVSPDNMAKIVKAYKPKEAGH